MTNICNRHLLIKNSKIKMKKLFNNLMKKNRKNRINNNNFIIKINKIKKIIHAYQHKNLFTKITINIRFLSNKFNNKKNKKTRN